MSKATIEQVIEQAKQKAEELSKVHGQVHPLVFANADDDGDFVVGFFKEPPRAAKMMMLDRGLAGAYSTANSVLEGVILKDHSDPRLWSESSEHDAFVLGATQAVYARVQLAVDQLKKK